MVIYLFPFLANLSINNIAALVPNNDGFDSSIKRSFILAASSSFINIILSLVFAIRLSATNPFSKKGIFLSVLIVPCLLGNVSTSFAFKLLLDDNVVIQQSSTYKFLTALFIQFWQYGTLYTYILWLALSKLDKNKIQYASVSYFSSADKFRHIILPGIKNLLSLLFIINFLFTVYEDSKFQLIFKSSRGTDTELISQYITRFYQADSLINPIDARHHTYSLSFMFIIILFVLLAIIVSLLMFAISRIIVAFKGEALFNLRIKRLGLSYYLVILFVIIPLAYILFHIIQGIKFSFSHLMYPLILSGFTALISLLIAIVLGISFRMGWLRLMASLNTKSQFVLYAILSLLFVPGMVLSLVGYQWFNLLSVNVTYIAIVWILGHILMVLPIITCFIISTHFSVTNSEIEYMNAHQFSFKDILCLLFLGRFKGDYFLTFLICMTMIWNDPVLNSILSDYVPSFISEMKMSIVGRGADYGKGISYFTVSLIVSLGAWLLWIRNFNTKKQRNVTY